MLAYARVDQQYEGRHQPRLIRDRTDPDKTGSPAGGGARLAPVLVFPKLVSPTRKRSPPVSVRETQDPCQRGADRIRNSPSPERNT